MGALLYRLSKRSVLLRRILAVKPERKGRWEGWGDAWTWAGLGVGSGGGKGGLGEEGPAGLLRQVGAGLRVALSVVCGGTRVFADCDPVW